MHFSHEPWHCVHLSLFSKNLGFDLVSHGSNSPSRGPNELNLIRLQQFLEIAVLTQESVPWMHCLSPRSLDHLKNSVHFEVGVLGRRRSNAIGLICLLHEHSIVVCVRVHSHRLNAHLATRLNHSTGDLTSIGYQNLIKCLREGLVRDAEVPLAGVSE